MGKDYYQILGISRTASEEEIKKAFRALAHQHHPDKQGGNEEKFKEINEAYQILKDKKKRAQYDQFGSGAFDGSQGFGGGSGQGFGGFDFSGFSQQGGFEDLGDLFGDMFGFGGRGGRARQTRKRGGDIQMDLDLTFSESVFGVEKEINIAKTSFCQRCGGTGGEPGTKQKTCERCGGSGVIVQAQRTILGVIQSKQTCEVCQGSGEIPETSCDACQGLGVEKKKKTLRITIPSGVEEGSVLRVHGEGESVKGGIAGDLFVRLSVRTDKRFHREGQHIYSEAEIGFTQAALGDTIEIETVEGKGDLKIPAGTQSGTQFRLKAKGVPMRSGRGDQIVIIKVMTPKKLSRKQRQLL